MFKKFVLGGGGPYFASGPDEVRGGDSKGYRGAVDWRGGNIQIRTGRGVGGGGIVSDGKTG